jgi:hypothetical protein
VRVARANTGHTYSGSTHSPRADVRGCEPRANMGYYLLHAAATHTASAEEVGQWAYISYLGPRADVSGCAPRADMGYMQRQHTHTGASAEEVGHSSRRI